MSTPIIVLMCHLIFYNVTTQLFQTKFTIQRYKLKISFLFLTTFSLFKYIFLCKSERVLNSIFIDFFNSFMLLDELISWILTIPITKKKKQKKLCESLKVKNKTSQTKSRTLFRSFFDSLLQVKVWFLLIQSNHNLLNSF